MNAVPMREFEGLVTVAGRPHSKPVALAVRAAKAYAWERQGRGSETAGQAGTA